MNICFGIWPGIKDYREFLRACESFEVPDAEERLSKMIVADYVMANFDRHRSNFGLLRNADTLDGWMIAPLFDNGSGFFSRASLAEVSCAQYLWRSAPFEEYPSAQLARASSWDWYDPSSLTDFPEELGEFLLGNAALPTEFVDCSVRLVAGNIEFVNRVARERKR